MNRKKKEKYTRVTSLPKLLSPVIKHFNLMILKWSSKFLGSVSNSE